MILTSIYAFVVVCDLRFHQVPPLILHHPISSFELCWCSRTCDSSPVEAVAELGRAISCVAGAGCFGPLRPTSVAGAAFLAPRAATASQPGSPGAPAADPRRSTARPGPHASASHRCLSERAGGAHAHPCMCGGGARQGGAELGGCRSRDQVRCVGSWAGEGGCDARARAVQARAVQAAAGPARHLHRSAPRGGTREVWPPRQDIACRIPAFARARAAAPWSSALLVRGHVRVSSRHASASARGRGGGGHSRPGLQSSRFGAML